MVPRVSNIDFLPIAPFRKAVALASRLADESGRAIGEHYGIGSAAIGAIHRRLADRRDTLDVVEALARQLKRKRTKYKA